MLRRRPLNAGGIRTLTSLRSKSSSSSSSSGGGGKSQLCIKILCGVPSASLSHLPVDSATVLSVPLELTRQTALASNANTTTRSAGHPCGPYHQSGLHASRVLLASRLTLTRGSSNEGTTEDQRGPYDVTIDEVLLHSHENYSSGAAVPAAVGTVADLVRLLVDPDLEVGGGTVEAVSLRDFVVMTPKRKLKAVGGDTECLDVLMSSERYQSEKDARELRLLGVATVGQWKEQPDRVPLSAYARGLLETAYSRLARHRQQSQKDEVVAWLTRAIQRAVADELMAPKRLSDGAATAPSSAPLLMDLKASAVTAAGTAAMDTAKQRCAKSVPQKNSPATAMEEEHGGARPAAPQDPSDCSARSEAAAVEEDGGAENDDLLDIRDEDAEKVLEEVLDGDEEFEDEEMEMLMAEAEVVLGRHASPVKIEAKGKPAKHSTAPPSLPAAPATPADGHGSKRPPKVIPTATEHHHHHPQPRQQQEVEAEVAEEEDEELIEEVEEAVEEEEEEAVSASTSAAQRSSEPAPLAVVAAEAAVTTTAVAAAAAERKERLIRLSELMMKQFNTADGYLHPTSKAEREAHEKRGDIVILDEDTAQVDPLAMFSAYHAATVTDADPIGVRALKTIWTSYNKHQMSLEEATDEAAIEFYKRESVNALLYGSVLMRSLAREEHVVVLEGTPLPPYGFPLVSSDTRPFATAGTPSSSPTAASVTDMTPAKVLSAIQAYKTFFSSKDKRYSPFRPAIDQSAGCSVVCLSGTTLHLYHTSTKDHIIEEEVRLPFSEVMLGVLHLFRNKALPRVNVVHYHLIATKIADPADDSADYMLRSTATIDLTNPFTKEEVTRLRALAAPLGMADEMDEYRCIDDLVMDIEETSGASVVHSLLHNREDLEATLTATLAQLLPEDGDGTDGVAEASGDAVAVEEEEEAEVAPLPPPPPHSSKKRGAAAASARSPTPRRRNRHPAVYEEDQENAARVDDEQVEELMPAQTSQGKHRSPVPTTPPTTRRAVQPAQTPATPRERQSQEEAEFERAIYSQLEQKQQAHRPHGTGKAGAAVASAPVVKPQQQHHDNDDDDDAAEEEEEEDEGDFEEAEDVEEIEDDDVDDAELPSARPPARASVSSTPAASAGTVARHRGAAAASPAPPAARAQRSSTVAATTPLGEGEEVDGFEEEEEEEEVKVVTTPTSPRAPVGRRTVPAAAPPARPPPPPPPTRAVHRTPQEVDETDEEVPQVRMRRGVRRTTARARSPLPDPLDSHKAATQTVVQYAPEVASAANTEEDQWFRRRPKRRYFE